MTTTNAKSHLSTYMMYDCVAEHYIPFHQQTDDYTMAYRLFAYEVYNDRIKRQSYKDFSLVHLSLTGNVVSGRFSVVYYCTGASIVDPDTNELVISEAHCRLSATRSFTSLPDLLKEELIEHEKKD